MHSSFHRLALAVLLAGSASLAPLLGVGAASPSRAGTGSPVAAVRSVGAVVALTAAVAPTAPVPSTPAKKTPPAAPTVTHGMLAAILAGTGTYGVPLISGCTWATWVTNCQNLTAYGNGSGFNNVGCGPPNGCKFGPEFQCEELADRYAYYAWGEPANWYPYGAVGGASTMWQAGPALPIPLTQYPNGSGTPPMQGDLMIFAPGWLGSYWDGSGHVAIVRDVGPGYVDVVEQNATSSGTDRFPLGGSRVTARGYTPIIGWLRETEQAPVELTSSSVAGAPQSVSDQPGNIDVIWRGTDTELHDLAYRSETWQSVSAITPAGVASDPAVVSPVPGQVDAFWEDGVGNLWQVQSQSGFFGSESWTAPQELQVGALAVGSAPTAVSQAPGEMEVIWKAVDGQLWVNTFNGAWSGATPLNSGAVLGNPDAVATSNGTVGVAWRDAAGNLWSDLGASFGWFGAHEIGTGRLASDPTVVTAGAGAVDAIWRTQTGSVWAATVTPNGGPAQVEVDSAVSMGQPAAAGTAASAVTVVMQRANGSLAAAIYDPINGWVGPQQLNQVLASAQLSAVSWYGNAVAAFWQGTGNSLWWSPACDGCAAHPPPVFKPAS
jgi:CHAP domain